MEMTNRLPELCFKSDHISPHFSSYPAAPPRQERAEVAPNPGKEGPICCCLEQGI